MSWKLMYDSQTKFHSIKQYNWFNGETDSGMKVQTPSVLVFEESLLSIT